MVLFACGPAIEFSNAWQSAQYCSHALASTIVKHISCLQMNFPLTGMTMIMQESSLMDAVQHAACL